MKKVRLRLNLKTLSFFVAFQLVAVLHTFCQEQKDIENDHACLLNKKSIMPGFGLTYEVAHLTFGGQAKLFYAFSENFCLGPEVNYSASQELKELELSFVAHYIFDAKIIGIYPIFGFGVLNEKRINHEFLGMGGVLGFGLHRNLKRITVFTETTSFIGATYGQNIIGGLFYRF